MLRNLQQRNKSKRALRMMTGSGLTAPDRIQCRSSPLSKTQTKINKGQTHKRVKAEVLWSPNQEDGTSPQSVKHSAVLFFFFF